MLFLNLGSGRGFSHTFLFIILGFIFLHFASKRKSYFSIPFLIGMTMHLILDLPEVPLFYPFINYDFIIIDNPLWYWFYELINNPLVYLTEIGGILIILSMMVGNKLFRVKNFWNYLSRNEKNVNFQDN